MSSVSDYVTCKQCGFEEAYYDFNCNTNEWDVSCGRCGYYAAAKRHEDNDGKVTWTYPEEQGFGVLFYRGVNDLAYCHHPLHSKESVEHAEKWLREKVAAGQVRPSSAYLSRWDKEANAVEFVIGHLFEPSGYDPNDEVPEQMGPDDLRPFQLVEKRCQVKLRYSCKHVLDGWILLLDRQRVPPAGAVFRTDLPCLACLSQSIKSLSVSGADEMAVPLGKRRTQMWENRWLDGSGEYVTPAFDHPQTLEEAASRFYAAYPGRKQCHPESMGFHLQLEGWSDEDIAAKKWLSSR
jgi:hypothetical protein